MSFKYKMLAFSTLILVIISCNFNQESEIAFGNRVVVVPNLISVIDSLRDDDSIENRAHFIYACEHLFDFESLQFETQKVTTEFLKKNLWVNSYNDNLLITINYGKWSKNGNSIKLILLDKQLNKLGEGIVNGCHYHNGETKIVDWNHDGLDEVQYRIDWPTQSTPYIEHIEDIYRFSESFKLEKIFNITLETRDCSFIMVQKGEVIERNYQFQTPQEIKVVETVYTYDCENFEWHYEIKKKEKLESNNYFMVWNENMRVFEKQ